MGARYCGACSRASAVISAASAAAEWSFQSQACAASVSAHAPWSASGRALASTGSGVEPVVSTPIPMTRAREKPGWRSASARAPLIDAPSPAM